MAPLFPFQNKTLSVNIFCKGAQYHQQFLGKYVTSVCEGNILSGDLELPRHDKKFNWATFNELHNLLPHKKED